MRCQCFRAVPAVTLLQEPDLRPSLSASRIVRPPPCRRWQLSRSYLGATLGCGQSATRIECAPEDRLQWSAHRESAYPGRGSAHSTDRVFASYHRTIYLPGDREKHGGQSLSSTRRYAVGVHPHCGRTDGQKTAGCPRLTTLGKDSYPGLAACRQ